MSGNEIVAGIVTGVAAVIVGFLLSEARQFFKEKIQKAEESRNLRRALHAEIQYNKQILRGITNLVRDEEQRYHATFATDSVGGWSAEGDPWAALFRFQPNRLSNDVWKSQLEKIPATLSGDDMAKLFTYYRNLVEIERLHAIYSDRHQRSSSGNHEWFKATLELMEETVNKPLSIVK